jgi:hypothetical protein
MCGIIMLRARCLMERMGLSCKGGFIEKELLLVIEDWWLYLEVEGLILIWYSQLLRMV